MSSKLVAPTPRIPALPYGELVVPLLVAAQGERAAKRYVEFFAARIRNPNTRRAYARAAADFLGWCERRALALPTIEPVHVAAYVEQLLRTGLPREPDGRPSPLAAHSVKQQLAAVRMLSDWFVVGQVVPHNPAASVRGAPSSCWLLGKRVGTPKAMLARSSSRGSNPADVRPRPERARPRGAALAGGDVVAAEMEKQLCNSLRVRRSL